MSLIGRHCATVSIRLRLSILASVSATRYQPFKQEESHMTLCPIAMAVHCTGCPMVKFCPAKTILGDFGKENKAKEKSDKDNTAGDKQEKSEK